MFVGTVEEGLGVYVYPTDRFKTVTLYAAWISDLRSDTAALTALVPYCLRRGTVKWPSFGAMEARLDDLYGASFRADVGKLGDKQLLSFRLEVADGRFLPGHPDTLAEGLEFLAQVMQHPALEGDRFACDMVDQEKEILRRQIEGLINDKAQYATIRCLEQMAGPAAFGIRRYGRAEDLEGIDAERVTEWWRHGKRGWPLVVFVVGAADPGRVTRLVRDIWSGRDPAAFRPVPEFAPRDVEQVVVERQEVQQGKLAIGYGTGVRLKDAAYPALMMYAGVLGGFAHSKLFINVREKASLAYYAYARLDAAVGLLLIGAGIEFKDFDAAVGIIRRQVDDMAAGRISDEEMAFTVRAFMNELRSEADSPGALIGRELERLIVGGGPSSEELETMLGSVSVVDIRDVAQRVQLDTIYFLTAREEGSSDA